MPSSSLSVAVLTSNRREIRRLVRTLEEGDVEVTQAALVTAGLELPAGAEPDAIVFSCASPSTEVKESVLAVKRQFADVPLVVLVDDGDAAVAVRGALAANAEGVLCGAQVDQALVATVCAVSAGQIALPQSHHRHARPVVLSHRECQVLRLAVEGMTNDSIARALFISRSTVKSHLTSAFAKLSVRSRSEAAVVLANPDDPAARLVFGTTVDVVGEAGELTAVGSAA